MTVYVDNMRNPYGRMRMSHMLADTLEELLAMADKIGVQRKWYQGFGNASCPHFDVTQTKRALALQHGAQVIERHELGALLKRIKTEAIAKVNAGQPHGWELPT